MATWQALDVEGDHETRVMECLKRLGGTGSPFFAAMFGPLGLTLAYAAAPTTSTIAVALSTPPTTPSAAQATIKSKYGREGKGPAAVVDLEDSDNDLLDPPSPTTMPPFVPAASIDALSIDVLTVMFSLIDPAFVSKILNDPSWRLEPLDVRYSRSNDAVLSLKEDYPKLVRVVPVAPAKKRKRSLSDVGREEKYRKMMR